MAKKIFLLLISVVIFFTKVGYIQAQEVSPTVSPTPAPIEYQLPYPGILPGHPFYWLKNLRDNLIGFLISNAVKKAEFELLQSDKNLQAAVYLYEQNKDKKAIYQALQASNSNLSQSIDNTQEAKKQGMDTTEISAKITIASLKHQEVVLGLVKIANAEDKKNFEVSLVNLNNLVKKAKALNPK